MPIAGLKFYTKFILFIKRIFDRTLFSGIWPQLITLTLLFMLLVGLGSTLFEQQNVSDVLKSNDDKYINQGIFWSLIHATDPGYLGGDLEASEIKGFWLGLIVTLGGWFLLSGFIMTIFINYYQSHLDKISAGKTRYYFYGRHRVIFGWNKMGPSVIQQLWQEGRSNIIILSLTKPEVILNAINRLRTETAASKPINPKKIYIYFGAFDTFGELKYFNFSKTVKAVVLGDENQAGIDSRNVQVVMKINDLAKRRKPEDKIVCYVHINSLRTYDLLQDVDLDLIDNIDFKPFNFYEDWARRLWATLPENISQEKENAVFQYPPLSYRKVSQNDNRNVHLIILGFGQMGQALAAQAARICHYANGTKTKVTAIDDSSDHRSASHNTLIFNSHYFLKDIPDIDFQVISKPVESDEVRSFLTRTVTDSNQITTIAVCFSDIDLAISIALSLPQEILLSNIPLLIRQESRNGLSDLAVKLQKLHKWKDIKFFGMLHECFGLDLKQDVLAARIHEEYRQNNPEAKITSWEHLEESFRWANRYQVDSYPELLAAVGYQASNLQNAENIEFQFEDDATVEWLAEREHDRWVAEKLIAGWSQADISECATPADCQTKRDNLRLKHIYLTPFKQLDAIDPSAKQKDRDIITNLPKLLKSINLDIRKKEKNESQ